MKSSVLLPTGLFLTFTLDSSYICAQATPEIIETLVVSGSQSTAKLMRQQATNNPVDFTVGARIDPAEFLSAIPGVQVDSRTNYAQDTRISLRGFGARSAFGVRGIDLLVDGIPMSTPDGQGQLSSVMLDTLASAQVLRGPLASLYGNGSGGVIALQTSAPERNQFGIAGAGGMKIWPCGASMPIPPLRAIVPIHMPNASKRQCKCFTPLPVSWMWSLNTNKAMIRYWKTH
jgi:iron complex outermembrane receptor protein